MHKTVQLRHPMLRNLRREPRDRSGRVDAIHSAVAESEVVEIVIAKRGGINVPLLRLVRHFREIESIDYSD